MPEQNAPTEVIQQTNVVKKDNRKRNIIVAVIIVLVLLVIIIAALLFASRSNTPSYGNNNQSSSTSSTQYTTTSVETTSISTTTSQTIAEDKYVLVGTDTTDRTKVGSEYSTVTGELYRFTSYKQGVTFTLFQSTSNGTSSVLREDNKIWVYPGSYQPHDGQSVEIFEKSTYQTFKQAIEDKFLQGYDPADCFVEESEPQDGIVKAQIKYPIEQSSDQPWWANAEKCPEDYSATNGVRYFYYDQNTPNKFAFFNLGQYAISGNANYQDWAGTFEFLK